GYDRFVEVGVDFEQSRSRQGEHGAVEQVLLLGPRVAQRTGLDFERGLQNRLRFDYRTELIGPGIGLARIQRRSEQPAVSEQALNPPLLGDLAEQKLQAAAADAIAAHQFIFA